MSGQWHPDPMGRHQLRFWDGTVWSEHVSDNGVTSIDPLHHPPPIAVPVTAVQPVVNAAWASPAATTIAVPSRPQQPIAPVVTGPASASSEKVGIFDRAKRGKSAFDAVRLTGSVDELRAEYDQLCELLVETRDAVLLQEVGLYEYRHPLDESTAYKAALEVARSDMQKMVRDGQAVSTPKNWQVDGNLKKGEKMANDLTKLVLRAYNNEADNLVRSMKPYNLSAAVERLGKARSAICRFVSSMSLSVEDDYHRLRVYELELTADFLVKKQDERERERAAREELREEERSRREFEAEQADLTRERDKRLAALKRYQESGSVDLDKLAELEVGLAGVQDALDGVAARMANVRAGHVYVISNIGSFGERMVKIGMTRRLDPLDRVRELGDASVPFRYDVHALVFAEDAVTLETKLHRRFAAQRVNLVNRHREFFHATAAEVHEALKEYAGSVVVEFTDDAEALEWRQSTNARSQADFTHGEAFLLRSHTD
jgi:Domain of unknown function (DUF4041)/T5orf172 domain/Protein of unknown function (DUF2510)